jgi:hypothetical protein
VNLPTRPKPLAALVPGSVVRGACVQLDGLRCTATIRRAPSCWVAVITFADAPGVTDEAELRTPEDLELLRWSLTATE